MKHLIKIEPTAHGVLGMRHAGLDQQYCEAGELVILKWQPDAGWGLQEAHYTDKDGNVTAIEYGNFVMPDKDIIIGGTFKRFVLDDWTGEVVAENVTAEGEVVAGDVKAGRDVKAGGDVMADGNVTADGNVSAKGNVSADGNLTVKGNLVLLDVVDTHLYKVFLANGTIIVEPL